MTLVDKERVCITHSSGTPVIELIPLPVVVIRIYSSELSATSITEHQPFKEVSGECNPARVPLRLVFAAASAPDWLAKAFAIYHAILISNDHTPSLEG